jgi:hypothetical protein
MENLVESAEYTIDSNCTISFKRGYGYYIRKKVNGSWVVYTRKFGMNPYIIGFKESRGFSFEDLKPVLFESFYEAYDCIEHVGTFPYWDYNQDTHDKVHDSYFRKVLSDDMLREALKEILKDAQI